MANEIESKYTDRWGAIKSLQFETENEVRRFFATRLNLIADDILNGCTTAKLESNDFIFDADGAYCNGVGWVICLEDLFDAIEFFKKREKQNEKFSSRPKD